LKNSFIFVLFFRQNCGKKKDTETKENFKKYCEKSLSRIEGKNLKKEMSAKMQKSNYVTSGNKNSFVYRKQKERRNFHESEELHEKNFL